MRFKIEIPLDDKESISLKAAGSVLRDDETGELIVDFESMTLCFEFNQMGLKMTEVPERWVRELKEEATKRYQIFKYAFSDEA